jgi:hypothetical protein
VGLELTELDPEQLAVDNPAAENAAVKKPATENYRIAY